MGFRILGEPLFKLGINERFRLGKSSKSKAWTPSDVSGLAIWLRSDLGLYQEAAGTTPATANNHPVGLWKDQSGNGRNFQTGTTTRPLLQTGILNNHPVIRFNGIDDYMNITSTIALPFTLFIVTATSGNSDSKIFEGYQAGILRPGFYLADSSGWKYVVVHAVVGQYKLTPITDTNFHIHRVVFADSGSHFIDGVSKNTGDFSNAGSPTQFGLGGGYAGGYPYNGDIVEVLLYSGVVSAPNIALVEAYLNERYFP